MKNLISMTDFVLKTFEENPDSEVSEVKMYNYANFLKQPLEVWMFVPCDEKGNVLEEPICQEYALAKERCLFEGFEVCNRQDELVCLVCNDDHFRIVHILKQNIEYLVQYNLQLTKTALKQIGL